MINYQKYNIITPILTIWLSNYFHLKNSFQIRFSLLIKIKLPVNSELLIQFIYISKIFLKNICWTLVSNWKKASFVTKTLAIIRCPLSNRSVDESNRCRYECTALATICSKSAANTADLPAEYTESVTDWWVWPVTAWWRYWTLWFWI